MATPLTQTHPLLSIPFSAATDFTELAGNCELCAETLLESDDPALRMAKRSSSPKRVYPMFNWCPFCKGTEILVAMKIESQWMTVSMMLTQIFNGCLRSVNEAIALRQRRAAGRDLVSILG
ncbi:hypothetical protein [Sodalis sp. RH16]|uniref:hypothetical protein n=1 Tax=Sodalis sp. RH16 TaxID=3394331 RepID=UPI0039B6A1FE